MKILKCFFVLLLTLYTALVILRTQVITSDWSAEYCSVPAINGVCHGGREIISGYLTLAKTQIPQIIEKDCDSDILNPVGYVRVCHVKYLIQGTQLASKTTSFIFLDQGIRADDSFAQ